jgi:hypothetical protein
MHAACLLPVAYWEAWMSCANTPITYVGNPCLWRQLEGGSSLSIPFLRTTTAQAPPTFLRRRSLASMPKTCAMTSSISSWSHFPKSWRFKEPKRTHPRGQADVMFFYKSFRGYLSKCSKVPLNRLHSQSVGVLYNFSFRQKHLLALYNRI